MLFLVSWECKDTYRCKEFKGGLFKMKNEYIAKRKSVRRFESTPLSSELLAEIRNKIDSVKPLFPDIAYTIELIEEKKPSSKSAPYCLFFNSEEKEGAYENIGFIGQQLSLYLTSIGLGSYFKVRKPDLSSNSNLPYVICMPFGKPAEPLFRELSEFDRKELSEISEGSDIRIEAARLAPSALNEQNWYFIAEGGCIHCYRKKPNVVMGFIQNKLNCIDMGIALCHIYEESETFSYKKLDTAPEKKGYIYMGTVI